MTLLPIPASVDLTQDWLVSYWAGELGVSPGRLTQAVRVVGPEVAKLKKYFSEGHRIAIRDDSGVVRLAVRITLQKDGLGVSVPYHPVKQGWLYEMPVRYDRKEYVQPLSEAKHYTVEDTVKLSMHMTGFVQFSGAGGQAIISGYNAALDQIKGVGMRAPDQVHVTTGPLFGIFLQGLGDFKPRANEPAEVFEEDDLWHHPDYSTPEDTAYHLEVFMLPLRLVGDARPVDGKRMLKMQLPFKSILKFDFHLRVIELPGLPFFLGAILSHSRPSEDSKSGYRIFGPGCGGPGEQKKTIAAWYPRPEFVSGMNPISLDYRAPEESGD
jgi:Protein of unknown function (DUF3606)